MEIKVNNRFLIEFPSGVDVVYMGHRGDRGDNCEP